MRLNLIPLAVLLSAVTTTLALPQPLQDRLNDVRIYRRDLERLHNEISAEIASIAKLERKFLVRRGEKTDKIKAKIPGKIGENARQRQAAARAPSPPRPPPYMSPTGQVLANAGYTAAAVIAPSSRPPSRQRDSRESGVSSGNTPPSYHSKQPSNASNKSKSPSPGPQAESSKNNDKGKGKAKQQG